MNEKLVHAGMVQTVGKAGESRDKVYNGIAGSVIKTASDNKAEKKEEKTEETEMKKEFSDKMTKKEAEAKGFFKVAKPCGWGMYNVADLDGGQGSIWYLEKDAETGNEFLVKQTDPAGDVVRRTKPQ